MIPQDKKILIDVYRAVLLWRPARLEDVLT